MKINKLYILILLLISILTACSNKYEIPNDLSDASFLISKDYNVRIKEDAYKVNKGEFVAFSDLSRGALSHEWTIDKGCQFMRNGYGKTEEDYSKFVIPNAGLKTTDKVASVYFGEEGDKSVTLSNTFKKFVFFKKTGYKVSGIWMPGDSVAAKLNKNDGLWHMDTTFKVKVYGDVKPTLLVLHIKQNDDGEKIGQDTIIRVKDGILDSRDSLGLNIGIGEKLRFINKSTYGEPDSVLWTIKTGDKDPIISSKSDTTITFNTFNYKTDTIGVANIFRNVMKVTGGGTINQASAIAKFPLKLKVGASTKPFRLDGGVEDQEDANSLKFRVNGPIDDIGIAAKDAFTVTVVKNIDNAKVSDIKIPVTKVTKDLKNSGQVVLTLKDRIYNTDSITVKYEPTRDDQKIFRGGDKKEMNAFPITTVTPYLFNVFVNNAGFETGVTGNAATKTMNAGADGYWDGANQNKPHPPTNAIAWARTDEKAAEGKYSMKFSLRLDENLPTIAKGTPTERKARVLPNSHALKNTATAGEIYRIYFKLFLAKDNEMVDFENVISGANVKWNLSDKVKYPRGKWLSMEQKVFILKTPVGKAKTIWNYLVPELKTTSDIQTFYVDDAKWVLQEERP